MAIVRWSPYRGVFNLQDRINRMFDEYFVPNSSEDADPGSWHPPVDIKETVDAVVLEAELPGVKKEDISIEVKENVLNLRGERTSEEESAGANYYRRERIFGSFSRSFSLPMAVNPEDIKASFKNGVLRVSIPKPEEKKLRQINIS